MIPKILHLCWLSGDEYPAEIKRYISTWKEKCPGYEIKVWSKDSFDILSVRWVKEAFEAKKYAFAADYIRFWALYNYGGIYLDSDVEILKSFDEFLCNKSFMCFEYLNFPEAAVIGAEPKLKWVKRCLDFYDNKSFFYSTGEMKTQVVPHLVKIVLEKELNVHLFDNGKIQEFNDIVLYPYWYFSPKNYFSGSIKIHKNTYAIHRFASAWGPAKKRTWTLKVHNFFICILGKKMHDKLFRKIKKWPNTFNGDLIN